MGVNAGDEVCRIIVILGVWPIKLSEFEGQIVSRDADCPFPILVCRKFRFVGDPGIQR